jgi:hypothetical protein
VVENQALYGLTDFTPANPFVPSSYRIDGGLLGITYCNHCHDQLVI